MAGQRPLSSRKDARDAVVAARKAFGGWAGATAYNRGQILYRIAEMLEGRRGQFVHEVREAEGLSKVKAAAVVDAAIDRWVWYAGWTDKIGQVVGAANPVAGPFFNLSTPEPTGVVTVVAPQDSSFLGLVSVIAPVIATGNTVVVIASEKSPLPALSLGEVLATSDLPGGVVNILSGKAAEMGPHLASHQDVNAIDLAGSRRGACQGAGDRRGRQPQARPASTACGRLDRRPGHVAHDGVPGDQDGLAPHGFAGRVRLLVLGALANRPRQRPPRCRGLRVTSLRAAAGRGASPRRRWAVHRPRGPGSGCR